MRIALRASAVVILAVSVLVASPAQADPAPDTVTGGDVSGPGDQVSPEMQTLEAAKAEVAAAYAEAKEDEASVEEFQALRRSFAAKWGIRLPGNVSMIDGSAKGDPGYASNTLGVAHYPQINSYFCGPASGKMILKYLNAGVSAFNGAVQDQPHIGGSSHMKTEQNGKTSWGTGLFRIGLNRWRQGSDTGFYMDKADPTPAEFRNALGFDIDNGFPFAADTVEFTGGQHYNGHPETGQNIGHWIVARGYADWGNQTKFADPSTSVWGGVSAYFTTGTNTFVNTYLNSNGMTW